MRGPPSVGLRAQPGGPCVCPTGLGVGLGMGLGVAESAGGFARDLQNFHRVLLHSPQVASFATPVRLRTVLRPPSRLLVHLFQGLSEDAFVKIFVGNLNFKTSQDTLQELFAAFGTVDEVFIATDRETQRPRGFAFVTMSDDNAARSAIEALNGKDVDGRTINVNEARPRTDGPGGGRGGFGGGGGRGGRGGGGGDRW